ncbi:MAG: hypothetical protein K9M44_01200 [Candidatus Pacebacteria bacterium]|nr:hypothetical protein [Candidatus Paceibacterota bacterium]
MSRNFSKHSSKSSDFKNQKVAIIILAVCSLAIILFSFWQLKDSIYGPFSFEDQYQQLASLDNLPQGTCQGENCVNEEELKNKDTDGDGLNDWEELNFYMTSPYLEDTDSDGINDKLEVESNSNPNCPSGQNCDQAEIVSTNNDLQNALLDLQLQDEQIQLDLNTTGDNPLEAIISGEADANSLRSLLIEAGMEADMVNAFTDEELLTIYNETLSEQSF